MKHHAICKLCFQSHFQVIGPRNTLESVFGAGGGEGGLRLENITDWGRREIGAKILKIVKIGKYPSD